MNEWDSDGELNEWGNEETRIEEEKSDAEWRKEKGTVKRKQTKDERREETETKKFKHKTLSWMTRAWFLKY